MGKQARPSFDFEYEIIRSTRKTVAIHVTARGVQVRIPKKVSDAFAIQFLTSKQEWVSAKVKEQNAARGMVPKLSIGERILWQGKPCEIRHQYSVKASLVKQPDHFAVSGPERPSEQALIALFESFFKQQAKHLLINLTHVMAEKMGLDNRLISVRFRRTKSKWGHCTSKGSIQFNWLIMGAPIEVIEYLVIHEVAHLKHPNHQPEFWALVEQYCSDYKKYDKWLKDHGVQLSWM